MSDVIASFGLEIPTEFNAYPDHLSLECEIALLLYEADRNKDADQFIAERFAWLGMYIPKLEALNDTEAPFFKGLANLIYSLACQKTMA